jgi:Bacterial DNA polymerase III alpha NTPase domain
MKTTELDNRTLLDDGTVICDEAALVQLLYAGHDIGGLFCAEPETQIEWETATHICDDQTTGPVHVTTRQFTDKQWYLSWHTPAPYHDMDILKWCLAKCSNDQERQRVHQEIAEMSKRNMLPVLRHLVYAVDKWREHGVFWGVGRGSSVSSFVLYLIGINRINPLEYGLDIAEWLKSS